MQCPLCQGEVHESEYLRHVFPDDDWAYRIAILITHYRHNHINSYNRACHSYRYAAMDPAYKHGHDMYKAKVNNRAKRQLIRGILKSALKDCEKVNLIKAIVKMQYNDKETMALRRKALDKLRHKVNQSFWVSYDPQKFEVVTTHELVESAKIECDAVFGKYRQATIDLQW